MAEIKTTQTDTIFYTKTDEAPALATYSFLPIVKAFTKAAGIKVELKDISLSGRILAHFPEYLTAEQRVVDALAELGELSKQSHANIIKLPNISASVPQLLAAIKELQQQGYPVPDYPAEPANDEQRDIQARYAKILGSAVNPVLREGNSDRRVANAVKAYAKANPHSMGAWSKDSKSHVAHMQQGDFFGSEQSVVMPEATTVRIELLKHDGEAVVLKEGLALEQGEIIDAACMSKQQLQQFYAEQLQAAKEQELLFSLHLKATMMKVSDPILFGACLETILTPFIEKHQEQLTKLGFNPNLGLGTLTSQLETLPEALQEQLRDDLTTTLTSGPKLAMVDSDKGITNLHVPSDVIIDASMPAMLRNSGQMWGPDGKSHDTIAVIPDRCYAEVYQQVFEHCRVHGAFDPKTMGSVANVGLMAKKAEEYGSHDKTFQVPEAGLMQVIDESGKVLMEHPVDTGDIWRMCQTKAVAVVDWVKLAVKRARAAKTPAVFWLNEERAHDRNLIAMVNAHLAELDTGDIELKILAPREACKLSLERCRAGQDTISVTGNVLRDYLTDLFPILELGTSAKMLSIVPLLAGGGLFETGAGGSAPKHVQQVVKENHLRWDSLGEFLALAVSIEDLASKSGNKQAKILAEALDQANTEFLVANKSPSRRCGELDNRGSHFYLAKFWAEALAKQDEDQELKQHFTVIAEQLATKEEQILEELLHCQGKAVDLGGYYHLDEKKTWQVMRPSAALNEIIG